MTNTQPDTRATLERYVAALQEGDEDAVRDSFTVDAVWRLDGDLPISGTWQGRETIMGDFLGTAMSFFEPGSVKIEIVDIVTEGDTGVMQWTSRARTVAGDPYENHCIGVFQIRDGQIASVREYMDTLHVQRVVVEGTRQAAA